MRKPMLAVLAAAAVILGACGGTGSPTSIDTSGADPRASVEYLTAKGRASQSESASVFKVYDGLDELLPNAVMRCDCGQPDQSHKTILVRGKFKAVEKGTGAYWTEENEREVTHHVPFGDSRSGTNTLHLTFAVAEVVPAGAVGDMIRVGVRSDVDEDITKAAAGWIGLGNVALVIYKSVVYDYDQSLWGIWGDELFTMPIAANGTLSLPFAEPKEALTLLARTPTWAAAKRSATDRRLVVPAHAGGATGLFVRADGSTWRE